jgi:hypothetical protein
MVSGSDVANRAVGLVRRRSGLIRWRIVVWSEPAPEGDEEEEESDGYPIELRPATHALWRQKSVIVLVASGTLPETKPPIRLIACIHHDLWALIIDSEAFL